MSDSQPLSEVVEMLQADIRGEHAAIIQYLQHVYRMESAEALGDIPCEIEEIARDEMRHYRWLSEVVASLGGGPTIDRDPIFVDGSPPPDLVRLDIAAENRAIDQYRDHIARIEDPKIKGLLERILLDELFHKGLFRGFIVEMGEDPDKPAPSAEEGPFGAGEREMAAEPPVVEVTAEQQTVQMLNQAIQREYATVLVYLYQSFVTDNLAVSKELQVDISQWHMKHMGWLSVRIAEMGGNPSAEHDPVEKIRDLGQALQTDISREQETQARLKEYWQAIDDFETREILERILGHEAYQETELREMLARVTQPKPAGPPSPVGRLTVGSLIRHDSQAQPKPPSAS